MVKLINIQLTVVYYEYWEKWNTNQIVGVSA